MAVDFNKKVDESRVEIERIREQIEWVKTSPLPKSDLKPIVAEMVKAQLSTADYLNAEFRGLADPDIKERAQAWRQLFTARSAVHVAGADPTIPVPLANLLCWLAGDDLVRWMDAKVEAMEYVPGPAMAERRQLLSDLRKELEKLEREEERLITEAEAAGVFIPRRFDATPEIVLGFNPDGAMYEPGLPRARVKLEGVINAVPDRQTAPAAAAPGAARSDMPAPAAAPGARVVRGAGMGDISQLFRSRA
jgi:hypothetical protein